MIERYSWWHRPCGPPAAVTQALRAADIREIEMWLSGSSLLMLLEASPDYDTAKTAARDAHDPGVRAWERLMSDLQTPLPGASGEKWIAAESIYTLSEQP